MTTIVTDSPEEAARFIRDGETVAFPTETVYGLGADAFAEDAVRKIFQAKGRPQDNPLIVHVASISQIDGLVDRWTPEARTLVDQFFPGPLTIILPKSPSVPSVVTSGLETIGIRMPDHPVASAFLEACGRPVAAPSANRSGHPSPTTWEAVWEDLQGRVRCILQGGRSRVGLESTVVDCTSSPPEVLRAGAVSVEQLHEVLPEIRISSVESADVVRSPGMRHRHYAPRARVTIVETPSAIGPGNVAYIGLDAPSSPPTTSRVCESVEEYAHELFDFFRMCDASGIETIYCQSVSESRLGRALMDRLRRASEATAGSAGR